MSALSTHMQLTTQACVSPVRPTRYHMQAARGCSTACATGATTALMVPRVARVSRARTRMSMAARPAPPAQLASCPPRWQQSRSAPAMSVEATLMRLPIDLSVCGALCTQFRCRGALKCKIAFALSGFMARMGGLVRRARRANSRPATDHTRVCPAHRARRRQQWPLPLTLAQYARPTPSQRRMQADALGAQATPSRLLGALPSQTAFVSRVGLGPTGRSARHVWREPSRT